MFFVCKRDDPFLLSCFLGNGQQKKDGAKEALGASGQSRSK